MPVESHGLRAHIELSSPRILTSAIALVDKFISTQKPGSYPSQDTLTSQKFTFTGADFINLTDCSQALACSIVCGTISAFNR